MEVTPTHTGYTSPNPIDAPVCQVTLLEDRARVVRRGTAEVGAGRTKVYVDDVAPVLSDKTLQVRVAGDAARVVDARLHRRSVFDPVESSDVEAQNDADRPALVLELSRLDAEIQQMESRHVMMERHASGFDQIAGLSFGELAEDVSWGRPIGESWDQRLDDLRKSERDLRTRLVELHVEIEKKRLERERIRQRIEVLTNAASREWAAIEIEVVAEQSCSVDLEVVYVVPGACWRPYHTAKLTTSDGKSLVEIRTDATVWQNTGEDWNDVELSFSTERPSLGTEPPELFSDVLRVRKRRDVVEVEARDQAIQTTGLGGEAEISPELPGIDDGGATLELSARHRASVPSNGRPFRARIAEFSAEASAELVAFPELSPLVIDKTIQVNKGEAPLLAGPVDLIRDSGLIGRTSVLYVAPNEKFELGWGPHPELRIKRVDEVSDGKSKMLSSWIARTHKVTVRLSNIGPEERTVKVCERIPVSEIEKVEISLDRKRTTTGDGPDDDGLLRWPVTLAPLSQESVEVVYEVKHHKDVVGL